MNDRIVWSDSEGDLRKKNKSKDKQELVNESSLCLEIRRLTSGKGRTVIEITALPANKNWCKKLAKDLKKKLGVGGAYKNDAIEIHGEKIDAVSEFLNSQNLKWKKVGG
jgi:translation initiation factor 1